MEIGAAIFATSQSSDQDLSHLPILPESEHMDMDF